ncbi:MAG TPA: selenoneine biosynthesis selenosugar synthase SenB [Blastocatellia bacterium]|nr:selenoneine biosynthesis selenosugar synthase SenB [Blastocatellia bacterium]
MKILITTPAPPRSRYGNRVTALRWARILKELGHRVTVSQTYENGDYDLLVSLHARRSYTSIDRFHRLHPDKPLVVALSGTDLYRDLKQSEQARESLELATRLVVLQPKAFDDLPPRLHAKTRVIYQSAQSVRTVQSPKAINNRRPGDMGGARNFTVCVIGHLRPVKDPFRAALAARLLPPSSRIRVLHIGGAMSEGMAARAREEMKANPRYLWLGEQPRWRARRILTRSHLCVLSSRLEGGANVLSESIAASAPVVASRIPGTVGILGEDYPGYFTVGDTCGLRQLLIRAETDPDFLSLLRSKCDELAVLFEPACEKSAWRDLLSELNQVRDSKNATIAFSSRNHRRP